MRLRVLTVCLPLLAACAGPAAAPEEASGRGPGAPDGAHLLVVGTVQDGGLPHAGCDCARCSAAVADPARRRRVASLALLLPDGGRYLFDATPDIVSQLADLPRSADAAGRTDRSPLEGLFLTHAHMGHYLGLAFLGYEAIHARGLPLYVTPRFAGYLRTNGPWDQLVRLENVVLRETLPGEAVALGDGVSVEAIRVPHRDEYSDTVGFLIRGPRRSVFYAPDTDGWDAWERPVTEILEGVDVAILDATFYSLDELPGRDVASVPHPLVTTTMDLLQSRVDDGTLQVRFTHLNHSNPLLEPDGDARREVDRRGYAVLEEGERIPL